MYLVRYCYLFFERRNISDRDLLLKPSVPYMLTCPFIGDHFDLMDGVLGMALSPYRFGEDRKLFYHAMSSDKENFVYTSNLKNQSLFEHDPSAHPELFHVSDTHLIGMSVFSVLLCFRHIVGRDSHKVAPLLLTKMVSLSLGLCIRLRLIAGTQRMSTTLVTSM